MALEENWILLVMQWDTLTDKCWESIICISIQLGKDQKYVVYLPFFRLIISDHQEIITLVRFKDLTDLLWIARLALKIPHMKDLSEMILHHGAVLLLNLKEL